MRSAHRMLCLSWGRSQTGRWNWAAWTVARSTPSCTHCCACARLAATLKLSGESFCPSRKGEEHSDWQHNIFGLDSLFLPSNTPKDYTNGFPPSGCFNVVANIHFLFLNPVQYNDDGRTAEVPAEKVSCWVWGGSQAAGVCSQWFGRNPHYQRYHLLKHHPNLLCSYGPVSKHSWPLCSHMSGSWVYRGSRDVQRSA